MLNFRQFIENATFEGTTYGKGQFVLFPDAEPYLGPIDHTQRIDFEPVNFVKHRTKTTTNPV